MPNGPDIETIVLSTSSSQPTKIASAGDPPTLFVNTHQTANMWISARESFEITTFTTPIGPLGSVSIQPFTDLYASTNVSGAQIAIIPGGISDTASPAAIALQIAGLGLATSTKQDTQIGQLSSTPLNTIAEEVASLIATGSISPLSPGGTPLLHGADALFDNQNFALAANTPVFTAQTVVSKPGYIIAINPFYTTANGTNGFVQVDVRWLNLAGTKQIAFERWMVPCNAIGAATNTIFGKGPTKGPKVQLRLTNLDTLQPVTFNVDLWETTQHISRDDWRSGDVFAPWSAPPGFTAAPNSDPSSNTILQFATPPTLAVGTVNWLLPLYAGQANLSWSLLSAGGAGTVNILIQELSITGTSGQGIIYSSGTLNLSATVPNILNNEILTLPRRPCLMQVSVGGFPLSGSIGIQPLEYAS